MNSKDLPNLKTFGYCQKGDHNKDDVNYSRLKDEFHERNIRLLLLDPLFIDLPILKYYSSKNISEALLTRIMVKIQTSVLQESGRIAIRNNNGIKAICDTINANPLHYSFLHCACASIQNVSLDDENKREIALYGGTAYLMNIIKRHANNVRTKTLLKDNIFYILP